MKTFRKRAYARMQGSKLKRLNTQHLRVTNVANGVTTLIYRNHWELSTHINERIYIRTFAVNNWNDGTLQNHTSLKNEINDKFAPSEMPF